MENLAVGRHLGIKFKHDITFDDNIFLQDDNEQPKDQLIALKPNLSGGILILNLPLSRPFDNKRDYQLI